MSQPNTVTVNSHYQITLPSAARQQLNIAAGDRLLVDVQDGLLILMPAPADYVEELAGLHKAVWAEVDVDTYLNRERDAW
jgi:AbrB family looped-hinge helix DNA binding protein